MLSAMKWRASGQGLEGGGKKARLREPLRREHLSGIWGVIRVWGEEWASLWFHRSKWGTGVAVNSCNRRMPRGILKQELAQVWLIFFFLLRIISFLFFFFFFLTLGLFIYLFIYLWLCWVFVSVWGLSLVAASGGHSSSRCVGLSLSRPLLLRSTGSRCAGSVIVAHGPSCSAACGIFPDQGSNPCPLRWQADSQPLHHQGSPTDSFLTVLL